MNSMKCTADGSVHSDYRRFESSIGVTFDLKFRGQQLNEQPDELQ